MSVRRAKWRKCLLALIGLVPVILSAATPVVAEMLVQNPPATVPSPEQDAQPAAPSTPKPEQQRPSIWGEPTEVRIGMYVIDVDGIDSANQRFSASVYLQARWNIPLLRHDGPAPLIRPTLHPTPENGLQKQSQVMIDKTKTVRRDKLGPPFGRLDDESMLSVTRLLAVFLGLA